MTLTIQRSRRNPDDFPTIQLFVLGKNFCAPLATVAGTLLYNMLTFHPPSSRSTC